MAERTTLISDEIVAKAWHVLQGGPYKPSPAAFSNLRAALETVEGDIIEEFGAAMTPREKRQLRASEPSARWQCLDADLVRRIDARKQQAWVRRIPFIHGRTWALLIVKERPR
jgi:hypothetical protein